MQGVGGTIGEEGIRTLGDGNMKPEGQKLKINISIKNNAKFITTNMAELQTLQQDHLREGAQEGVELCDWWKYGNMNLSINQY